MAAALSLTMGRLGALVGNLLFGYLIDLACVVPIIIFAAFLFCKYLGTFTGRFYNPSTLQGDSIGQNKTKIKSSEIAVDASFLSY